MRNYLSLRWGQSHNMALEGSWRSGLPRRRSLRERHRRGGVGARRSSTGSTTWASSSPHSSRRRASHASAVRHGAHVLGCEQYFAIQLQTLAKQVASFAKFLTFLYFFSAKVLIFREGQLSRQVLHQRWHLNVLGPP